MKKIIYTLSFLAFSSLVANAQTSGAATPVQGTVGMTQPSPAQQKSAAELKKTETPTATEPQKGTRMAINEKGVPASKGGTKSVAGEKDKAAKTQKNAAPAQQGTTSENK